MDVFGRPARRASSASGRLCSVSYTHLDVYKRQSLKRSHEQMDHVEHVVGAQRQAVEAIAGAVTVHPLRAAITAHAGWKKRLRAAIENGTLPAGATVESASRDTV